MKTKLCVVFDIDETLIHFISPPNIEVWNQTSEVHKKNLNYAADSKGGKLKIIIFRPCIKEIFTYFMENRDTISVGLWTYSERDYAHDIGEAIRELCGLPKDFFLFRYGVEDMGDESYPKDLRTIYANFPEFNVFNTFLVDDAYKNLIHDINKQNSILIAPYGPYSHEKKREFATSADHKKSKKDTVLRDVMKICKAVVNDIEGCDAEDIKTGFKTEHVFAPHRVKRMKLDPYFKTYQQKKNIEIMNIGNAIEYEVFGLKKTVKTKKKTKKSNSKTKSKSKSKSKSDSSDYGLNRLNI